MRQQDHKLFGSNLAKLVLDCISRMRSWIVLAECEFIRTMKESLGDLFNTGENVNLLTRALNMLIKAVQTSESISAPDAIAIMHMLTDTPFNYLTRSTMGQQIHNKFSLKDKDSCGCRFKS